MPEKNGIPAAGTSEHNDHGLRFRIFLKKKPVASACNKEGRMICYLNFRIHFDKQKQE